MAIFTRNTLTFEGVEIAASRQIDLNNSSGVKLETGDAGDFIGVYQETGDMDVLTAEEIAADWTQAP